MRRRETIRGGHRGNDTEVHKRDKENRKLQQELRAEKEKLNSTIIKYQREMTEMQAVSEHTHTHTHQHRWLQNHSHFYTVQ